LKLIRTNARGGGIQSGDNDERFTICAAPPFSGSFSCSHGDIAGLGSGRGTGTLGVEDTERHRSDHRHGSARSAWCGSAGDADGDHDPFGREAGGTGHHQHSEFGRDYAQSLPDAHLAVSYLNTNIFIRGVGEPDAQGEPSVGIYIDGIYVPKNAGAQQELLDVEQVDIYRGAAGAGVRAFGRGWRSGHPHDTPDATPRLEAAGSLWQLQRCALRARRQRRRWPIICSAASRYPIIAATASTAT